jgi:hypothetical protein
MAQDPVKKTSVSGKVGWGRMLIAPKMPKIFRKRRLPIWKAYAKIPSVKLTIGLE